MPVEDYLPELQGLWDEVDHKPFDFFRVALDRGLIDQDTHDHEVNLVWTRVKEEPIELDIEEVVGPHEIPGAIFHSQAPWYITATKELLKDLWEWLVEKMRDIIDLVIGAVKPAVEQAYDQVSGVFQEAGNKVYDTVQKLFAGTGPVTPEDAPVLASKLYGAAFTAGMGAHAISVTTELLHPLKRMGIHHTAAMVGDFGQFGRIAGAVMGPLVNGVLGQLVSYQVMSQYRPKIPDDGLLIEFRSKREIDKGEFDKAMAYQGFSQKWIDIIERWQWKDPRMFEIIRLADVGLEQGSPPASEMPWLTRFGVTGDKLKDWWLYRKFMRAGYEDVDLPVMVNFIHRREVAFALTYVRTAIRRNYRWGEMTEDELTSWIDKLKLPEQAKDWIKDAGNLDREHFYKQDLIMYYKTAYREDVIDDDELLVSLLAMGQPAREAEIITRTERVRKMPKVRQKVRKEAEKAQSNIQKQYIRLYREQYDEDLITAEQYLYSLKAIGLTTDLAEVTVQLEAAKKGLPAPL